MPREFTSEDMLLRLLLASIAGLILGFPHRLRAGGMRSHYLVTLGAALFCSTAYRFAVGAESQKEVLRVMQGITSGVGFVGAASVLKRGGSITGVANAASIWIAAAVGCEVALGNPWLASLISLFVAVSTAAVAMVEKGLLRRGGRRPPDAPGPY
ncbi:MgtC/SapB family protein [Myxococcaceae bacterium GXIMD 01537]